MLGGMCLYCTINGAFFQENAGALVVIWGKVVAKLNNDSHS